jgi:hypothetical protein
MKQLGIFPFNHDLRRYLDCMAQISKYWIQKNASRFKQGVRVLMNRHYIVKSSGDQHPTDDLAAMLVAPYVADKVSWSLRGRGLIPGATFERANTLDHAINLVSSMDIPNWAIKSHMETMDRFIHQIIKPRILDVVTTDPLPPPPPTTRYRSIAIE